ncbi:phosphoinositide phospholipase C 2-like isoform X2 [Alnus glutinosa]|uniref:phosphoinositide phospholipase C 2-like isoform X2 n=1 Tax=Alnus glutinosa TaxID=3517 RepID=UPI002D79C7FC|nr:phosphoinositide phospholipase C 2-like isoform X2 [Alnus glutinosa]
MSKQQHYKVCFCFRRIFKLRVVEPPEDIKNVFERYSENGTMSIDQLHEFLIQVQGDRNASKDHAQAIFNSLKHLNIFQRKGLHLEAFFRYLLGDLNLPLHPHGVHQDMNAPLAHYFLFTGHNSYLTGNQLSSDSSVEPIVDALQRGVRVIELDLWPNPTKSDVEVRHGGTLTSPVELIKCLKAIKDNAFSASDYPVVITFEDHLNADLQAKVAKMVTKTFGAMLYSPESECIKEFPSPESLKKRVLISTKPPECLEVQNTMEKDQQRHKDSAEDETRNTNFKKELGATDKVEPNDEYEDEENATPQYRSLIAIHAGKPKGALNIWETDPNKVRRLSLSEQELENAASTYGTDIVRFTQKNLLRIYPKGMRLDSSNYDPMLGWRHGAQMVAFNMQGEGKYLWIMQGMFRANGGCGYVKKPDFLLQVDSNNEVFDPRVFDHHVSLEPPPAVKTILKVKVYMGEGWRSDFSRTHFDLYSPPDFFVRIGIAGVPIDQHHMKHTQVIEDDWQPAWNKEFEFPLRAPELAVLRIEVAEYDASGKNDFGGQTCLPVSELRSGIRAVPLHDKKGNKFKNVRLLMRIELIV